MSQQVSSQNPMGGGAAQFRTHVPDTEIARLHVGRLSCWLRQPDRLPA